jgi:hypothetical protein
MNRAADSQPDFTPKQGQYLAFIHAYTLVNGRHDAVLPGRSSERSSDGNQPREGGTDLTPARGRPQYPIKIKVTR